jgi:Family of unknown function (DUF6518)
MTTYPLPHASAGSTARWIAWVAPLAAAVVAGVGLGVADVAWSVRGGPLWTAIGNSCAGWATAAFVLGFLLRLDALRSAVVGVVMLAVAVETYYAAAWQWLGSSSSTMTSDAAVIWLVLAVVVGAPLGCAGGLAAGCRTRVLSAVGYAVGAAIPLGDALHVGLHSTSLNRGLQAEALLITATLVLVPSLRRPTVFVLAAAFCVPLAVVAAQCFELAGVSV